MKHEIVEKNIGLMIVLIVLVISGLGGQGHAAEDDFAARAAADLSGYLKVDTVNPSAAINPHRTQVNNCDLISAETRVPSGTLSSIASDPLQRTEEILTSSSTAPRNCIPILN